MTLTLKEAITANQTTVDVDGTDSLSSGDLYAIEDEQVYIVAAGAGSSQPGATAWQRLTIQRGQLGTSEVAHAAGVALTVVETPLGAGGAGGGITINLTGTETEQGHFFRGDEDPADTPAYLAILEAGDIWVDTTPLTPVSGADVPSFVLRTRNAANDGWVFGHFVATDEAGLIRQVLVLTADSVAIRTYDDTGAQVASILSQASGITIVAEGGATSTALQLLPNGEARIFAGDESIEVQGDHTIKLSAVGGDTELVIGLAANAGPLTLDGEPIGTRAAPVADVAGADPADIAVTLNELLAALRASNELET